MLFYLKSRRVSLALRQSPAFRSAIRAGHLRTATASRILPGAEDLFVRRHRPPRRRYQIGGNRMRINDSRGTPHLSGSGAEVGWRPIGRAGIERLSDGERGTQTTRKKWGGVTAPRQYFRSRSRSKDRPSPRRRSGCRTPRCQSVYPRSLSGTCPIPWCLHPSPSLGTRSCQPR